VGAVATLGPVDHDRSPRRFEQINSSSPALESVGLNKLSKSRPRISTALIQGRNRHRQGTDRARDSQSERAVRTPIYQIELRCHSVRSTRKRAFRSRARRVHGSHRQKVGRFELADKGTLFWTRWAIFRRACSPNCCGPAGAGVRTLGQHSDSPGGRSARGRDQPKSSGHGEAQRISQRPLLPSERVSDPAAALAGAPEDIPALVEHFVEIMPAGWTSESSTFLLKRCLPSSRISGRGTFASSRISSSGALSSLQARPAPPSLEFEEHPRSGTPWSNYPGGRGARPHSQTLEQTRWVVAGPNGAAARLGMKRSTLYFRMQKAWHLTHQAGSPPHVGS